MPSKPKSDRVTPSLRTSEHRKAPQDLPAPPPGHPAALASCESAFYSASPASPAGRARPCLGGFACAVPSCLKGSSPRYLPASRFTLGSNLTFSVRLLRPSDLALLNHPSHPGTPQALLSCSIFFLLLLFLPKELRTFENELSLVISPSRSEALQGRISFCSQPDTSRHSTNHIC